MSSEQNIPAVGSVWGNPEDTETWRRVELIQVADCQTWVHYRSLTWRVLRIDAWHQLIEETKSVDIKALVASGVDNVWDEVVEAISPAWPNEVPVWSESPRELITRLVNERDEATRKLDFLKSRGLTVGTMKESGKDPYLMYVMGSELCDLETVNKLVDAEIQRDKSQAALTELHAAITRGGLDISCCMNCGAPVVCIPDGLPMCEACAVKAKN
jgi:hypothetical protein